TESNPVWYSLTSSGTPVADSTANSATWRAAMTGTLIIPTIQNVVNGSFSKTTIETIIGTASSRDAHAQTLTSLIVNNAYDWLDGVLTYAESTIPKTKIIAGLPWYGYDWVGSSGTGVAYQQAMNTAAANGATVTHDVNGEATYTYSTHTVYFQDAYSYDQKV